MINNTSPYALNGTQLVLQGADDYTGLIDDTHTIAGDRLIITLGRLAAGASTSVTVPPRAGDVHGVLRSATALPIAIGRGGNSGQ